MPTRLRPTAPIASDAVLVGDPGRALLLAQELLEEPKMSNHARGLWGYFGRTPSGEMLTIQTTGIGGPSAALVLGDLAELGVKRVVRVGTCVAFDPGRGLGDLLLISGALGEGGSAASFGIARGETVPTDRRLSHRLGEELGWDGPPAVVASFDSHSSERVSDTGAAAADMQTAPLLGRARALKIQAAAVLIVAELAAGGGTLQKDYLEVSERRAGLAASSALSS